MVVVLQRTTEDGIGVEEIDTLQSELETLLASVAKRMRLVGEEEERIKQAHKVFTMKVLLFNHKSCLSGSVLNISVLLTRNMELVYNSILSLYFQIETYCVSVVIYCVQLLF